MPAGRPSKYSDEVTDKICEKLSQGISLREMCRADDMPGERTVYQWLRDHEEFQQKYAHAREAQADAIFDEILEIADDGRNDYIARMNDDGSAKDAEINHEYITRSRLRVDARKWMAGKLKPKVYGDKIQQEHSGNIGIEQVLADLDGGSKGLPET